MLDLNNLEDLDCMPEDQEKSCKWQLVNTTCAKGVSKPGPISHHSSIMHGSKMFLFGGN